MKTPKCINCRHAMKKISRVNKIFGKYIVSDTNLYVCETCGEEYLDAKEYERIRKKIDAIESKSTIPSVHEVIAKAKFLVL